MTGNFQSRLAELAALAPELATAPAKASQVSSRDSETDDEWTARLVRRAERVTRWALKQDMDDLAEHYAWMLLLVLEMRHTAKTSERRIDVLSKDLGIERVKLNVYERAVGDLAAKAARQHFAKKQIAKAAADARHERPGGSRHKQASIREIWATGKYTSRDICAEQECAQLGMSFSAARRALRNTPAPA